VNRSDKVELWSCKSGRGEDFETGRSAVEEEAGHSLVKLEGKYHNTKSDRNTFSTSMGEVYKQVDGHKLQHTYSVRAFCTKK
jgi:hypothetical protein